MAVNMTLTCGASLGQHETPPALLWLSLLLRSRQTKAFRATSWAELQQQQWGGGRRSSSLLSRGASASAPASASLSQEASSIPQFMPSLDIQLTINTFDADCCWALKFSLNPHGLGVGEHVHADRLRSPHDLISALCFRAFVYCTGTTFILNCNQLAQKNWRK